MKRIMQKGFFLIISTILFVNADAQIEKSISERKHNQDEKFITQVIQSLDEINPLRIALEEGRRGNGIHYEWMDEMKKLEVKQASYIINFDWMNRKITNLVIKKTSYHPSYYFYSSVISDNQVLLQIDKSGLGQKLEAKALSMANEELMEIIKGDKSYQGCGTLYVDLLDDERLPIISTSMTTINHKCPKSKNLR